MHLTEKQDKEREGEEMGWGAGLEAAVGGDTTQDGDGNPIKWPGFPGGDVTVGLHHQASQQLQ